MSAPTRIERARRCWRRAVIAALLAAPAHAAAAGQAPIARFIGHWAAAPATPGAPADQSHDLGFSVADDGDGFVIDGVPTGRPNSDEAVTAVRTAFQPTDRPDIYRAGDSTSPLAGGTLVWARIGAGTLDTVSFAIGRNGAFSLVETDRTLEPDGHMTVTLKHFVDGKPTPALTGHLERAQ